MTREIDSIVRTRSRNRCEYCLLPQSARRLRFQIDHIIARQHGGLSQLDNLALCRGRCNRHKGPNLAGIDPDSHAMVRLFHPRNDAWHEHFFWQAAMIVGKTPIGRATIELLFMNHPDDIAIRLEIMANGQFPYDVSGTEAPGD